MAGSRGTEALEGLAAWTRALKNVNSAVLGANEPGVMKMKHLLRILLEI